MTLEELVGKALQRRELLQAPAPGRGHTCPFPDALSHEGAQDSEGPVGLSSTAETEVLKADSTKLEAGKELSRESHQRGTKFKSKHCVPRTRMRARPFPMWNYSHHF